AAHDVGRKNLDRPSRSGPWLAATSGQAPQPRQAAADGGGMTKMSKPAEAAQDRIPFHPLADIFPLLEGAEFDALVADIKANGLRFKIILHEGMILDGRNRYRAMLAAGHTPIAGHFSKYKPILPGDTPLSYVVTANL